MTRRNSFCCRCSVCRKPVVTPLRYLSPKQDRLPLPNPGPVGIPTLAFAPVDLIKYAPDAPRQNPLNEHVRVT